MDIETLKYIKKPARYLGSELHAVRSPEKNDLRVGLAFPDHYEIGMSHIGMGLLYHCLNQTPGIFSERIYLPDVDMEAFLRQRDLPLTTLETRTPLKELDILGFSLAYELTYTNLLAILELGGIPLRSEQRTSHPLVIAGGPCAFNPEPLSAFIDAFVIGEAEYQLVKICQMVKTWQLEGGSKQDFLTALDKMHGLYVPSLFEFKQQPDNKYWALESLTGRKNRIKKCSIADLDAVNYPDHPLVPFARIIHDRVCIECARGCPHACRFCQASVLYRPYRERSPDRIWDLAQKSLKKSGYEEMSLLGLSVGDYSTLGPLISSLMQGLTPQKISLSLPSLRVGSLESSVVEEILKVRKTGFTLAPEAASVRLRNVINKNIQEEELFRTVQLLARLGWRSLKLYFMIGLPTETEKDISEIIYLTKAIRKEARKIKKGAFQITVNISTFVPKAHTPFQWERQITEQEAKEKQHFLQNKLQQPGLRLKWHDTRLSLLEGMFARGDRKVGDFLEAAYQLGCRRDGWSEHLRFDLWQQAIEKTGINPDDYLSPPAHSDAPLPWDWIDTGVSRSFLVQERQRAYKAELTPFKCTGNCKECGLCREPDELKGKAPEDFKPVSLKTNAVETRPVVPLPARSTSPAIRLRMQYSKQGQAVCLSHLETLNLFQRALRRSGLPIYYTAGEHPHPKVAFSPALPVGVESLAEYVDLWFFKSLDQQKTIEKLNAVMTDGISFISAKEVPIHGFSLEKCIVWMEYEISFPEKGLQGLDKNEDMEQLLYIFNEKRSQFIGTDQSDNKAQQALNQAIELSVMPEGNGFFCRLNKLSGSIPSPLRVVEMLLDIHSWNGFKPRIKKIQTAILTPFPSVPSLKRGSSHGK